MIRLRVVGILLALLICSSASAQRLLQTDASTAASAPILPDGFELTNVTAQEFDTPVALAVAPDGKLFVAEQRGRVYIVDDGAVPPPTIFLDLEDQVLKDGDRGLLGIALDPEFESNGFVYVYYVVDYEDTNDTHRLDAFARLVRYTVDPSNPDVADPASRHILIGESFEAGIPACHYSHNGGTIAFGSDGSLLLSTGDAGSFFEMDPGGLYPACFEPGKLDPSEDIGAFRSLRLESLAGKILRIDPETGLGYPSNPFYTGDPTDNASKVWAYGLRNPFRFSVHPDGSEDPDDGQPGIIFVADVGWETWEELEPAFGGENFGWPCWEGPDERDDYVAATPATNGCETMGKPVLPHFYFHHSLPNSSHPPGDIANSLLAGDIYEGHMYPIVYRGSLFYLDFYPRRMWFSQLSESGELLGRQQFGSETGYLADMAYDPTTSTFVVVDAVLGDVKRLLYRGQVSNEPASNEVPAGLSIEQVHPNPVSHEVSIRVAAAQPSPLVVAVFDMLGRRVHTRVVDHPASLHEFQLSTGNLAAGVYRLVVSGETGARAATTFTVAR